MQMCLCNFQWLTDVGERCMELAILSPMSISDIGQRQPVGTGEDRIEMH